jgi:hypothetical protein
MACLKLQDLIASWNGLLTEQQQRQQAEHLAGCAQCQQLEKILRDVRALLPLASSGQPLGTTLHCPEETELVGFLYARADEATAAPIRPHLAGCRHCLGQVAALVAEEGQLLPSVGKEWRAATEQAKRLVAETKEDQGWSSVWLVPRWVLATGAAAVLVATSLIWYQLKPVVAPPTQQVQRPTPPAAGPGRAGATSPTPPSPKDEPTLLAQDTRPESPPSSSAPPAVHVRESLAPPGSSLGLVFPQEGQRVSRQELEFRWQAVEGARLYEVAVLDRRGDVVWDTEIEGLSTRVPDNVPLLPGERYFVCVVAQRNGEGPVRSPSVAFEIQPQNESP